MLRSRSTIPIRVCFVIDNLSRAGTEMQLLLLLKHLDRTKLQPFLCLLDGETDSSCELEPNDIPVLKLGVRRLRSLHAARQAMRFRQYLKHHRFDVVQAYFPDSTHFAAPLAKAAGVTAVFGSRRNIGHSMTKRDMHIARFYNRFFIDKIVANCEAARQSVIDQENANPVNVIVIPNGIDLERFKHIPHWAQKSSARPCKVGMVGNLREVKGPDIFIRAAKVVLEKHPHSRFEIAGEGASEIYQDLIRDLEICDRVQLLGPVSDIPAFLATLDIAVLPSRAEGLSNAILEYMAAGRPIVVTDVGGNTELIQNRIQGLTIPANRVDALAQAVLEFLNSPALAAECAANALSSSVGLGVDSLASRFSDTVFTTVR
jgi:glycosyltransferase involved in cell wall biosynthesis